MFILLHIFPEKAELLELKLQIFTSPTRYIAQNTSPPQNVNFLAAENNISENSGSYFGNMMYLKKLLFQIKGFHNLPLAKFVYFNVICDTRLKIYKQNSEELDTAVFPKISVSKEKMKAYMK